MENLADIGSVSQPVARPPAIEVRTLAKRLIAGNPFYLISAGLLLYGINQLTTDPKLVGAEFSMLRFNFCALIIYEVMLVATAVALARRGIWYDALLLVGLANLFVIIPFSLISRAVYLSPGLALVMCVGGTLLAFGKFWAFKRLIPSLNLPTRLLTFGAMLLLANASAPLIFRAIADNPAQIAVSLNVVWVLVLPMLASLANWLPRQVGFGGSPERRGWLPLAFYLGWIGITACHLGGIGYSLSFDWSLAVLVPVLWVASWTLHLRRSDFMRHPNKLTELVLLFIPLFLPLLAVGDKLIHPIFASLNVACFALRFVSQTRSQLALIQVLGAIAILVGGLPTSWVDHAIPGMSRAGWIVGCIVICFFWLIFLSRDPRIALVAVSSLLALCVAFDRASIQLAVQIVFVSILAHSLRWEHYVHKGSTMLRSMAGILWFLFSSAWLRESTHDARLPVYVGAFVLLICYGVYAIVHQNWKPWTIPVFAVAVMLSEPGSRIAKDLNDASPGFLAIAASFLLFALGSVAAFSKSKRRTGQMHHGAETRSGMT